jgi:hypothetical protein
MLYVLVNALVLCQLIVMAFQGCVHVGSCVTAVTFPGAVGGGMSPIHLKSTALEAPATKSPRSLMSLAP